MKFIPSLVVLSLGLSAAASPVPCPNTRGLALRDTNPNTSVVPLTLYALFHTLEEAVTGVTPILAAIVTSAGPEGELPTSSAYPFSTSSPIRWTLRPPSSPPTVPETWGPTMKTSRTSSTRAWDLNAALNTLVPKLGLDGLLTSVDAAVSDLLTSLNTSPVPGLLAALKPLLVGLGGVVGGLLARLNLSSL